MNVLSLCSGVGGLDLGVRWALSSSRVVCYVESDPFCQAILVARMRDGWLDSAPIWPDLRTFDALAWCGVVDLVVAGFPCQPFSVAGKRQGADDPRNLWPDLRRVIADCAPGAVFLENVPGAMPYFFHVVLPELQSLGYHPAAGLFTAAEVGAPHRRQRLFVLARRPSSTMGDSDRPRLAKRRLAQVRSGDLRDEGPPHWPPSPDERDRWAAVLTRWPHLAPATPQPSVRRVADGAARRVDRLRALGNAVVPAQAALAMRVLLAGLQS